MIVGEIPPPPIATSIIYSHDRGVARSHGGSQTARHIVVVDVHELNAPPPDHLSGRFSFPYTITTAWTPADLRVGETSP